jgi:hypothetical protein
VTAGHQSLVGVAGSFLLAQRVIVLVVEVVMDDLWRIVGERLGSKEFNAIAAAVGTSLLTAIVNLTWLFMRSLRRRLRWHTKTFRVSLGPRDVGEVTINLANWQELSSSIHGFYVIAARFGTEEYLEKFASDEERAEGRWRLAITKMSVRFDAKGNAFLVLKIPVHKYLGTQFKCFVAVRSDGDEEKLERRMQNWETLLTRCKNIVEMSEPAEPNPIGRGGPQVHNRLYFLFSTFSTCAVGTRRNNFILENTGDLPPGP